MSSAIVYYPPLFLLEVPAGFTCAYEKITKIYMAVVVDERERGVGRSSNKTSVGAPTVVPDLSYR